MRIKWTIPLSFAAGILVTALVAILILASGVINMGADVKPGLIERTLAPLGRDHSVAKRVPTEKDPCAGDPAAIASGFDLTEEERDSTRVATGGESYHHGGETR